MKHIIHKLYLKNFRNLAEETFHFNSNLTCIFGENGNGKTNILEAIFYIFKRKSFRKKVSFTQILGFDCEDHEILFGALFDQEQYYSGKIQNKKFGKNPSSEFQCFLNNKVIKKRPSIRPVIIKPFDAHQFFHTSSWRRQLIDEMLSGIDDQYSSALSKFHRSLRTRNAHLLNFYQLQNQITKSDWLMQLKIYDDMLAQYGKKVMDGRKHICNRLSEQASLTFQKIFHNEVHLQVFYRPQISSQIPCANPLELSAPSEQDILQYYHDNYELDCKTGSTRRGIHLDDYDIYLDGFPSQDFASTGQQKLAYYSLFFSFIELLKESKKIYPIVLIDDISGELDSLRWKNLIEYLYLKDFQVIITTANKTFEKEISERGDCHKIYIADGRLVKAFNEADNGHITNV